MALILHIYLQKLYYHPHDCALFSDILKSANIRAILIQSLNPLPPPPWVWAWTPPPPRYGPRHPPWPDPPNSLLDVGLETPPQPDPPNLPLGVGLDPPQPWKDPTSPLGVGLTDRETGVKT